jgi:hypothetical protein
LVSMVLLMSMDSCERTVETVETVEFADVLPCKKSSIRLRSLERPPAIVLISLNLVLVGLRLGLKNR